MPRNKGYFKRQRGRFKKNHQYIPPKRNTTQMDVNEDANVTNEILLSARLSEEDFAATVEVCDDESSMLILNDLGEPQNARILRPSKATPAKSKDTTDNCENGEYRIFHKHMLLNMINEVAKEHGECTGELMWDNCKEIKWGLCWIEVLKCKVCKYESRPTKLYEEVKIAGVQGRKAAVPNVGLAVGLCHTPIGQTSFRNICASIGLPPPSRSSLQNSANNINDKLVELNKNDMLQQQQNASRISILKGNENLAIEFDTAYNIPIQFGGTRQPGQPATQCFSTISAGDKIIEMYLGNKHCKVAQHIRSQGHEVVCPHHDGLCTQTIEADDTIGDEFRNMKIMYTRLTQNGLIAGILVTDGDSQACKAVTEVNERLGAKPPKLQRDPGHFAKNQTKLFGRQEFSRDMFPGHCAPQRRNEKRRFAQNMAQRCRAEMTRAIKKYRKRLPDILKLMNSVKKAILLCCQNKHSLCDKFSLCCQKKGRWKQPVIVSPSPSDVVKIEHCLDYRLSQESIEKTHLGLHTQKSESINRSLHRSLPNRILWSRNATGRASTTVQRLNRGFGKCLSEQLEAVGSNVARTQRIASFLSAVDRRIRYDRWRQGTHKYKDRRVTLREKRHNSYYNRDLEKSKRLTYAKGLMEPIDMQTAIRNVSVQHSYCSTVDPSHLKAIDNDHSYYN